MNRSIWRQADFWTPTGLGLAGAVAVLLAGGLALLPLLLALALLFGGLLLGWRTAVRMQQRQQRDMQIFLSGQQRFGAQVAPVWAGHIENSRSQMEDAISALTAQFSHIVERLTDTVLTAAQTTNIVEDGGNGLAVVFASNEEKLNQVLSSQTAAMTSMNAMLEQVESLSQFTKQLEDMASEVAKIAAQTNLLALNAAIEAARAGELGRGFSVVAKEFRMLSNQSGETGQRITQMVHVISEAISSTCRVAQDSVRQEEGSMQASKDRIGEVLKGFHYFTDALVTSGEMLKAESITIKADIGEALVQFQFQDRVSQMLTQVKTNVEHFPEYLATHEQHCLASGQLEPLDAEGFLAEMKKAYVMTDQHITHSSGTGARQAGKPAKPAADDEITFF